MRAEDSKIEFDAARELDAVDWAILYQEWKEPKATNDEIGEKLGLSMGAIRMRRRSYRLQRAREEFFKEPISIIQGALRKAAMVVIEALDSTDERVRVGTAIKMLYSNGILKREPDERAGENEVLVISTSREKLMIGTKEALASHGGNIPVSGPGGVQEL